MVALIAVGTALDFTATVLMLAPSANQAAIGSFYFLAFLLTTLIGGRLDPGRVLGGGWINRGSSSP